MLVTMLSALTLIFAGHCLGAFIFYFIHRFVFHGKLGKLPVLKNLKKIHTTHHARPYDLEKAFFPNWAKALIAVTMICVGVINIPIALGVCSFFPVYSYRHWKAHNGSKAFWALHHMQHHLVNPRANYGGIYPVIDTIFRTNMPPKDEVEQYSRKIS